MKCMHCETELTKAEMLLLDAPCCESCELKHKEVVDIFKGYEGLFPAGYKIDRAH